MSSTITPPESTSGDALESSAEASDRQQNDTPQRRPAKNKSAAGKFGRSMLMLVRRVHLYSGIFMFPWVLLYGFTGWFFNHPRMFTGDQVTSFRAADLPAETLTLLPTAEETASAVVEEMNFQSFMSEGPVIELTPSRAARYTGFLSYSVDGDQQSHQISVNPNTGDGEIRTTFTKTDLSADQTDPNPLASIRSVRVKKDASSLVQESLPSVIEAVGLEGDRARPGRRSAKLVFSAEVDEVPCVVTYNLANGSVSAVREDQPPTMEAKSFLQRMHLARTYSPSFDTRWVWALVVDAMFLSMVFWGVSGLMMWWQVKRTRLFGGGVLLASLVFAAVMAINMHDSLTTEAGRGGGHGGGPGGGRGGNHGRTMGR